MRLPFGSAGSAVLALPTVPVSRQATDKYSTGKRGKHDAHCSKFSGLALNFANEKRTSVQCWLRGRL